MAGLTAEARSQVDLVILKGADGRQASIPRAFITKVPMRLVLDSSGGGGVAGARFRAVVPADGRARSVREDLPWGTYELPAVSRVELTSYQALWGGQFLSRRTAPALRFRYDPAATPPWMKALWSEPEATGTGR